MKSFAISALLLASSAVAQNQWYNLVASAPGLDFDAAPLKVNNRYWHIGTVTNSSCGDVTPAVALVDNVIAFYNDGRSQQQYAFVDISGAADGLLAFTPPFVSGSGPQRFDILGASEDEMYLYYDNAVTTDDLFLACEDVVPGEYWIYPENAYGKSVGQDKCIEFQIKAVEIEKPTESCTYF
ncbi:unnamed protein product [Discula destructiva]